MSFFKQDDIDYKERCKRAINDANRYLALGSGNLKNALQAYLQGRSCLYELRLSSIDVPELEKQLKEIDELVKLALQDCSTHIVSLSNQRKEHSPPKSVFTVSLKRYEKIVSPEPVISTDTLGESPNSNTLMK